MTDGPRRRDGNRLVLNIRVQPRARREEVTGMRAGAYKVRICAAPVDGAANERLRAFLAREFGVARSRVRLTCGAASREKRVAIVDPRRQPAWLTPDAHGARNCPDDLMRKGQPGGGIA